MWKYIHPGAMGISGAILVALLTLAAHSDLETRKIPNRLTYPAGIAALTLNLILSACNWLHWSTVGLFIGGVGIETSLTGLALVLSGMFLLFLLGCGAGDVKLMTVVGALLGWRTAAEVWFCSLCIAAVIVVLMILLRQVITRFRPRNAATTAAGAAVPSVPKRIPLAPFFAAGAFCVLMFPLFNDGQPLWQYAYSIL